MIDRMLFDPWWWPNERTPSAERLFAVLLAPLLGAPWVRVFGNGALAVDQLDGSPPPPAGREGIVRVGVPVGVPQRRRR